MPKTTAAVLPAAHQAADLTNYVFFDDRDALVLSGGGARGAYQAGVLKAMAEWLPADAPCPFEVLIGASAGALNATALAAHAKCFRDGVQSLEDVWSNFSIEQVMRTDVWTMLRSGLHWMLSLLTGGWLVSPPRSLLDTAPLRDLLAAAIPLERIPENIASGPLRAVAVATTSYSTGQAVAFFDGDPAIEAWSRVRRAGVRRPIDLDMLMASAAIPFIFPAAPIDGKYFGDGAMRQLAPLSPAVHLGANRVLVIGTRGGLAATPPDGVGPQRPAKPGPPAGLRARLVVHGWTLDRSRAIAPDQLAADFAGVELHQSSDSRHGDPAERGSDRRSRGATRTRCHAACGRCCARSARSKPAADCS